MTDRPQAELEALIIIAEENYAHARDHEHLRAQVTSTLVGAAFILIGLGISKDGAGKVTFVAIFSILIGLLNVMLVFIHNNRFDRHVSIARNARRMIATVEAGTDLPRRLSLSTAWLMVASLPVFAGVVLLFPT